MILLAPYVLNKTVLRNELTKYLCVLEDKPFLNGCECEFATIQSIFHHLPISYVKTRIIKVHKTIILPLFVRCETWPLTQGGEINLDPRWWM